MSIKSDIYKNRKVWWLNPWIIAIALLLILVSVPMVLWIASYKSTGAVLMFVITYVSLLVFVLLMVKKSMLEPHLYVDEKEVDKKRKEIQTHRQHVQQNFLARELEVLNHGDKTTVLDVWSLDPLLLKRHPYFHAIETAMLDPKVHELHIRIQIGELQVNEINSESFSKIIISSIISFIKIIGSDRYLDQLKRFFHILVIEIYAFREDENRRSVPYPILSLLLNETALAQFAYIHSMDLTHLKAFGDIRFVGGLEIPPHRGIESMKASGL